MYIWATITSDQIPSACILSTMNVYAALLYYSITVSEERGYIPDTDWLTIAINIIANSSS